MAIAVTNIGAYRLLADCLVYPDGESPSPIEVTASALHSEYPEAVTHLQAFQTETEGWSSYQLQEAYTRAFDLSPQCVPYLSVFLFGEESYKRAELMTGLKAGYEASGLNCEPELPDHIAVVLRFSAAFPPDEWDELARWCIPGPLKAMIAGLDKATNPYRHVMLAVRGVFKSQYPLEFKSC